MKFFIKDLNEVDESLRGQYKKVEGGYQLDINVEDIPDVQKLKKNRDDILEEKREEARKRREAEEKLEAEAHEKEKASAKTREEFEALLNKEREKFAGKEKDLNERMARVTSQLKENMVGGAIKALATSLAGEDAALITPHIAARIDVVESDGVFKIVVKGKDGSSSDLTVDALGEEMKQDKMFASVINGRQSSGGGTGNGGKGGADLEKYFDPKSPEFSITKQVEIEDSNPALYKELSDRFPV